jgi:RHS repeat-associated protein
MQGQQLDQETGLFYNRYRYYDPAGGRYVTQDPIGLAGGTNKFIYPTNPVQMIDAFGLQPRPGNLSWGNWCGGGWSGGYETKIILPNSKPPVDSLDACCMVHDYCYAERERNKKQNLGKCDQSLKDACDKQMMDCVNSLPANTKDWPMPASKNVNGLILPNQQADVFRDRLKTLFGNENLRKWLTP